MAATFFESTIQHQSGNTQLQFQWWIFGLYVEWIAVINGSNCVIPIDTARENPSHRILRSA